MLLRLPRREFNESWVRKALGALFEIEHKDRYQPNLWVQPEWSKNIVNRLYTTRMLFGVVTFWDPPQNGPVGMRNVAQYYLDARNQLRLPETDCVWVMVWLQHGNFDPNESGKALRVVANFKTIVQVLKPTFVAVDDYSESIVKRKGKDPRRFAWGAMYYDADHVERIGVDNLNQCAAFIKEKWPDGSMWVQCSKNPFIGTKELTQQIEKELGLKAQFADAEPAAPKGQKKPGLPLKRRSTAK